MPLSILHEKMEFSCILPALSVIYLTSFGHCLKVVTALGVSNEGPFWASRHCIVLSTVFTVKVNYSLNDFRVVEKKALQ